MSAILTTSLASYPMVRQGKVRDLYDLGDHLLMVATDRISAFDVVMTEGIPNKGILLTEISKHWFDVMSGIVPHHLVSTDVSTIPNLTDDERSILDGRSMIVRKTTPLTVECVVRGYLAGSGWKEYQELQTVCGIPLPQGLQLSSKLPEPLYTPSTKAEMGHDENITFEQSEIVLGAALAQQVRDLSIEIYTLGRDLVAGKGLILADTKFEFGIDSDGQLILIDEVLTPDSSRYWLANAYAPGMSQENFDKQILRDWLETQDWNKEAPAPTLSAEVITGTQAKYLEAKKLICS